MIVSLPSWPWLIGLGMNLWSIWFNKPPPYEFRASLVVQLVKNLPAMWENLGLIPGLGRSPREGKGYPTPVFWPGESQGLYSPWGQSHWHFHSLIYLTLMVGEEVVRTFYSLNNFKVYDTVLFIIVIIIYIRSLEFIDFMAKSLYTSQIPSIFPTPRNGQLLFYCISEWFLFLDSSYKWEHIFVLHILYFGGLQNHCRWWL